MFSKKMLWLTLFSLLAQIIYMYMDRIPPAMVRPLLILAIGGGGVLFYLYSTGSLSEEKLVEKIAEHRDEPLADLHKYSPPQQWATWAWVAQWGVSPGSVSQLPHE